MGAHFHLVAVKSVIMYWKTQTWGLEMKIRLARGRSQRLLGNGAEQESTRGTCVQKRGTGTLNNLLAKAPTTSH